jgi:hypothetical protein
MAEKPVYVVTLTGVKTDVEAFITKFKLEANDDHLAVLLRRYARNCVAVPA